MATVLATVLALNSFRGAGLALQSNHLPRLPPPNSYFVAPHVPGGVSGCRDGAGRHPSLPRGKTRDLGQGRSCPRAPLEAPEGPRRRPPEDRRAGELQDKGRVSV